MKLGRPKLAEGKGYTERVTIRLTNYQHQVYQKDPERLAARFREFLVNEGLDTLVGSTLEQERMP